MAITDKEQGVWILNEVYAKQNEGTIWEYDGSQELMMVGDDQYGRLGLNGMGSVTHPATKYSSPTQVGGDDWYEGAFARGGQTAAMGQKTDGSVYSWGCMSPWGCGGRNVPNADSYSRSSPVQIFSGPGTVGSLSSNGYHNAFYRKSNGELWVWGANSPHGQLGLNSKTNYSSPVQLGTDTTWSNNIWSGGYASMAVKTDGTLWTWGANAPSDFAGVLGQGNKTDYSSPKQVGTDSTWATGRYQGCAGTAVMACVKTDGTLWTWGQNPNGVLGHNNGTAYSSPRQIPGTTWNKVAIATFGNAQAIKTDGTLWAWGSNTYGQLGHNNRTTYSSPKQVGTDTDWDNVFVMGPYSSKYSAAIKTDKTLWTYGWQGQGDVGTLGQNDTVKYSSPTQIPGTWLNASIGDYFAGYITDK